jgi:hypothetical protein
MSNSLPLLDSAARYAEELKHAAVTALAEETVMVTIEQVYHVT